MKTYQIEFIPNPIICQIPSSSTNDAVKQAYAALCAWMKEGKYRKSLKIHRSKPTKVRPHFITVALRESDFTRIVGRTPKNEAEFANWVKLEMTLLFNQSKQFPGRITKRVGLVIGKQIPIQ